jgi:hypothetical protein
MSMGSVYYYRGKILLPTLLIAMGNVVSSTADILAILGGVTTLVLGLFGAIRLSRCQTVRCCWGCIDLVNKPIAAADKPTPRCSANDTPPTPTLRERSASSEMDLAASVV